MFRPLKVEARSGHRLWIRYEDGVEGEVDLSDLAGRGVFVAWKEEGAFERAHIGPGGEIRWSDEIGLCPDALYLEVTGKNPEDLLPGLRASGSRA